LLNDRLYLNDGDGNFRPAPDGTVPSTGVSTAVLAAADFSGDGTVGVFAGGRVVPGKYPEVPRSFLYRNVGGKLVDVTDEFAPGLGSVGIVTAAAWIDIDGDKRPDLVVATEWGPVSYWHNTGKKLENMTAKAGLAGRTGWWSAITVADVNGDGRPDLVVGNVGLNTKYHATAAEPTVLFAGDFDGRGKQELIEAQYEDGKLYPVRGRSKLAYSFPWLPKKFPTYKSFSKATVEDIFGADHLAKVRKLTATELESGIFINRGDGTFDFQPLPRDAQIAPINTIVARDFNGDGKLDLFCAGNNFSPEATTGRFDGGVSVLLKGDGRGGFMAVVPADSGFVITGDVRSAVALIMPGTKRPTVVVSRCDGPLLAFSPRK
jgi:hypothetical protein